MKILLTGANGYIATEFYNKFAHTYDITKLTRKQCDLLDKEQVKIFFDYQGIFDIVIHCAGEGGSRLKLDSEQVYQHNIQMIQNLLSNKQHWKKMAIFGSGVEFDSDNFLTPYARSKIAIAEFVRDLPEVTIFRIWGVFNENERDTRFIKSAINNALNHKPIIIHQNQFFDFIHMTDLLDMIQNWIRNGNPFAKINYINCVYDYQYTLKQIAKMVNSLSDYDVEIIVESTKETINHAMGGYLARGYRVLRSKLYQRIEQTYAVLKNRRIYE